MKGSSPPSTSCLQNDIHKRNLFSPAASDGQVGHPGLHTVRQQLSDGDTLQLQQTDDAAHRERLGLYTADGGVHDTHGGQDQRSERRVAHHADLTVQDVQSVQRRKHVERQLLDFYMVQGYLQRNEFGL